MTFNQLFPLHICGRHPGNKMRTSWRPFAVLDDPHQYTVDFDKVADIYCLALAVPAEMGASQLARSRG
jgi:hypothetical protein